MRAGRLSFDPDEPAHLVFRIDEVRAPWVKRVFVTAASFVMALAFESGTLGAQAGSRFRVVSIDSGRTLSKYRDKLIWYGEVSVGQILRQDLSEMSAGEFAERWVRSSKRSASGRRQPPGPMSEEPPADSDAGSADALGPMSEESSSDSGAGSAGALGPVSEELSSGSADALGPMSGGSSSGSGSAGASSGCSAHELISGELLEDFVRVCRVPAVAAALVGADGSVDAEVAGTRRRGFDEPVRASDRWHIGSCAKTFTAVLWACLVEAGDAEWDMPIPAAFADLDDLHPGWAGVTVDDALQCRAGFASNIGLTQMQPAWLDARPLAWQRTDAARRALREPPWRPGRFAYSNLSYIVVGAAIDRLAGAAYERALADRVLKPLGIESAGFGAPPEIWGHPARLRLGVAGLFRGRPADPAEPKSDNPAVYASAGTLHLTVEDWAAFCRIFLIGGGDLLGPDTIEHLLAQPPGRGTRMSMGWIKPPYLRGTSYSMQGSNTMWAAAALLDHDRERAALVVANDGRRRALDQTLQFATHLFD